MRHRIMVVDDTETMRLFQKMYLTAQGHEVETASGGEEALRKIPAFQPHLVLLDLVMPGMNGIECCRQIKSDAKTSEVKVMMVTSRSEYAKISEAFRAGCDDYIVKPVNRSELLSKVDDLLKFSQLRELLLHHG